MKCQYLKKKNCLYSEEVALFTEGNQYCKILGEKLLNGSEMFQNKIIMWFDNSGDSCLLLNVSKSRFL